MSKNLTKFPYGNRRVKYENYIFSKIEAGVVLTGSQFSSLIHGKFDISKSYAMFSVSQPQKPSELFGENVNIDGKICSVKLLLHRREIEKGQLEKNQKKLILVVTKMYLRHHRLKLEIALAKRKKKYEKRSKIIKKQAEKTDILPTGHL